MAFEAAEAAVAAVAAEAAEAAEYAETAETAEAAEDWRGDGVLARRAARAAEANETEPPLALAALGTAGRALQGEAIAALGTAGLGSVIALRAAAPAVDEAAVDEAAEPPAKKRKLNCGACGQEGHARTNRDCPKFVAKPS